MNIKLRKTSRNASGFTLIELMVSLVIAMLVLGGVFQVFVKSSEPQARRAGGGAGQRPICHEFYAGYVAGGGL